ncbi:two-component system histidine kinase PnpS [Streptococcus didelphis]|uniref:two-component system histidine kinase PnpS n=1 Tax=Streptococcus didelphis TaxID=102886 RepID=UPI00037025F0|nr:ATP-binding protein [Streptococcus didelphis]
MKASLKQLLLLLVLALLAFLLAFVGNNDRILFSILACLFLLASFWPLRDLFLWQKSFQMLRLEDYRTSDVFLPQKQADLKELLASYGKKREALINKEAEIKKMAGNLEALMSHMTMGMFLLSKEKRIVLYSKSLPDYFPEIKDHFDSLNDLKRLDIIAFVSQAFETQATLKKELSGFREKDLILEVTAVPILDQKGLVDQVLVLLYDLTRIRSYEKLNLDFISNASHELRTPVTSIKGFAETIKHMPETDRALQEEFLEIIYQESLRLEHIVQHMLTLSKVEKTDVQKTSILLDDFLPYIGNSMKHQLKEKNLTLDYDLEEPFELVSDKYILSQILLNLLSNAIRYTEAGGQITIASRTVDDSCQISVTDTGIGMSQLELERIFERFYRVNKGRSRKSGGTGLGLSIVKELSQALGGQVKVSSQIGKGSTFTLLLPKQ